MSLATLSFVRPWWLLALLPLALLIWRLWRAPNQSAAAWRRLIDPHLLAHLLVLSGPRAHRAGVALFGAGLVAAVLALAGPALDRPEPAFRRDVIRLLVLDLSPGMTAQLEHAKLKMLALLQAFPDGETALLVYGAEPYLVVPLTTDVATIARFVPDLATDAIPTQGNRPDRALRMAGKILARSATRQREVVWITAGAGGANTTNAANAANAANTANTGSTGNTANIANTANVANAANAANAELPLAELAGARLSILHLAAVHDPALAEAARRTGGILVPMRADDGDTRQLAGAVAARGDWIAGAGTAPHATSELGYWLLLPLLPLAALAFRGGILMLLLLPLVVVAGLLVSQPASASGISPAALLADYQGWRLLETGQPAAAAARFDDPRWRAAANYRAGNFEQAASLLAKGRDPDSHYNRGNALARQGQLASALAAYDAALKLRTGDADTLHNRDLVQRLLNQQSQKGGGAARQPQAGQRTDQQTGQQKPKEAPPAPAPPQPQNRADDAERDATRVAEQWLRRIPDQPGSLLRRKLLAEQRRRQAGKDERAW
jgi:Ca-activated chloride channel homolog